MSMIGIWETRSARLGHECVRSSSLCPFSGSGSCVVRDAHDSHRLEAQHCHVQLVVECLREDGRSRVPSRALHRHDVLVVIACNLSKAARAFEVSLDVVFGC